MDWFNDLDFWSSNTFGKITRFLREEREAGKTILPASGDILNAFDLTPLENVKVVIIGQDPYPTKGHAHGLAFSVTGGTNPLPKSLVNIFRELKDDTGIIRTSGDLSDWAEQGVLLLNTALTVVEKAPGSHSKIGWNGLVRDVITAINTHQENVVFVLWGNHAQKYGMYIDTNKHHIIKSPHPSPLAAHRGFFGSKPFSKVNEYLVEHNGEPIKW